MSRGYVVSKIQDGQFVMVAVYKHPEDYPLDFPGEAYTDEGTWWVIPNKEVFKHILERLPITRTFTINGVTFTPLPLHQEKK